MIQARRAALPFSITDPDLQEGTQQLVKQWVTVIHKSPVVYLY